MKFLPMIFLKSSSTNLECSNEQERDEKEIMVSDHEYETKKFVILDYIT